MNLSLNRKIPIPIAVIIIMVVGVAIGGIIYQQCSCLTSFEKNKGVIKKGQNKMLSVPEDPVFEEGFNNTEKAWPPEEDSREELKQNPLCELRKEYCERIGYKYADFGCDCFNYSYYDSFKTYTDKENFLVYYPSLWQKNKTNINSRSILQTQMVLDRTGASCRLVYGTINEKFLSSIDNASSSTVNIEGEELSQITLPFDRKMSNEEKAAGYSSTKLIAVPHFPYLKSKSGFLIASGDEQPLIEACEDEFYNIIGSRIIDYPEGNLNSQSIGILSIKSLISFYEEIPGGNIVLVFNNKKTGKREAIAPNLFSQVEYLFGAFLTREKLYYLNNFRPNNPKIEVVDIFTGDNEIIPLNYNQDQLIHSFFVDDSLLYYLVGESCPMMSECNLTLKSYNINSEEIEYLLDGISSDYIVGLNEAGNKLILRRSIGDVLCSISSYEALTLSTKKLTDIETYSNCEGEEDQRPNFAPNVDKVPYLNIKDGNVYVPENPKELQNRIPIKIDTSEYKVDP